MSPEKNKATGRFGEEAAARFLIQQGWKITARNYNSRYGEIDIIAENGEYIAFVEVKTRQTNSLYPAAMAVTPTKQKKIFLTAQSYLMENSMELQPRFDVCQVYISSGNEVQISYLEDAFQPSY